MYEVVDYRNCWCGGTGCPGEKEIVLFEHKDKEQCLNFMLKESMKPQVTKTLHYNETKDKVDIFFLFGKREGRKRLRIQTKRR